MTDKKVWLVTGAGRGMGVDITKAALAAGHAVVATGRNAERVEQSVGEHNDLIVVEVDVTSPASAEQATTTAVERFGRIDVLVNNAGNFYAGYFEEFTPEQIDSQLAVTLLGPMNVARAVLPVMREQRSGHIVTITSTAGIVGGETTSAYAAAKFGAEGWMESLAPEVAPFGITTTLVEPGFFRTELLEPASTTFAELSIKDYAARRADNRAWWESMNGKQEGDPPSPPAALVQIVTRTPRRSAGSPAQTPSPPSSRRRATCSHRSTPTATSRARSRSHDRRRPRRDRRLDELPAVRPRARGRGREAPRATRIRRLVGRRLAARARRATGPRSNRDAGSRDRHPQRLGERARGDRGRRRRHRQGLPRTVHARHRHRPPRGDERLPQAARRDALLPRRPRRLPDAPST